MTKCAVLGLNDHWPSINQIHELPVNFGFTKASLELNKGQNKLDGYLK